MDITHISPSRFKQIRLCPARAMSKHLGAHEEEERGEMTLGGVLAHAAAKHWYRPNPQWEQLAGGDPNAPRIINGIDKHPGKLPDDAFRAAIAEVAGDRELPREASSVTEAKRLFQTIIRKYDRDRINVVGAERRYKGLVGKQYPTSVHLIIDLLLDMGNNQLQVVDFKTGFVRIPDAELPGDDQVLMNLMALDSDTSLARFPYKSFEMFWVQSGERSESISLSPSQLLDYEHWMMWQFDAITKLTPETAVETPNRYCWTCGRRNECVKYAEMVAEAMNQEGQPSPEQIGAMTDDQILERIEKIKMQTKILGIYDKALDNVVLARIAANGGKIEGTRLLGRIRRQTRSQYDTATVLDLAMRYGVPPGDVLSPRVKAVETVFQAHPEAAVTLEAIKNPSSTAEWVEVTAISKDRLKEREKEAQK